MTAPLLSLLVAGSLQWAPPTAARADFERMAIEIAQAVEIRLSAPFELDLPATVADVPFYYDRLMPAAEPAAPLLVTYDWRSPVVFDLP
jgi:hypothetical protein